MTLILTETDSAGDTTDVDDSSTDDVTMSLVFTLTNTGVVTSVVVMVTSVVPDGVDLFMSVSTSLECRLTVSAGFADVGACDTLS